MIYTCISSFMNGEESMSFLKLPNDLVLNCLARVSRLYYPILSLVSKRFRCFIVSRGLHKTRKLLGRTESCLYVSLLSTSDDYNLHWFTLCRRPNRNPKPKWFTLCFRPNHTSKKKSSGNVLIPIRSRDSANVLGALRFAEVGSACVIDNVLYSFNWISHEIKWFDYEGSCWRVLNGLKRLPKFSFFVTRVRLANYGGNLVVLWHRYEKCKIWCAEIALERRNEHEIWGNVEWFGIVLKAPLDSLVFDIIASKV